MAYSTYYLCARICWNVANSSCSVDSVKDWAWGAAILSFAMKYFIPQAKDIDLTNGNTYIFDIPMAIGLTADAFFQLPILQYSGPMNWNEDVISQLVLLWVLLLGLLVAFSFTLVFRGVIGIRTCYWGSALVVHGIVVYLVLKALPFVIMFFP